jgi:hypothetical protein
VLHGGDTMLAPEKNPGGVHVQHPLPVFEGRLVHGHTGENTGVVDQHIESPSTIDDFRNDLLPSHFVSDILKKEIALQFRGSLFTTVTVDVSNVDPGALLNEALRDSFSQTGGATGHQRNFAIETPHPVLPRS